MYKIKKKSINEHENRQIRSKNHKKISHVH